MAIQSEIWVRDIAENIYPDNSFFLNSRDDSAFLEGNKVHLPQSGTTPDVQKNRTVLPATAAKRTDSQEDYNVDEYTTDPVILQHTEEIEVSYAKRQSLLFDHMETLKTRIADTFAHLWAPELGDNLVRTSGTSRSAYLPGQTGNRNAVHKNDIIELDRLMNRMDIPRDQRILLIDADLYADLLKIEEFVSAEKIGTAALVSGAVGRLLGFNIFVRSSVVRYDNQSTPELIAQGTSVDTDDNLTALAWHPMFVRRALGNETNGGITVFEKNADPQFYGDVFSALVRSGGRKARTDEKGIVALVETAA